MAGQKRKTLPSDFSTKCGQCSLDELIQIFDHCALDATHGFDNQTALHLTCCPDELVRWLVEQGADINAPDSRGNTPLHERARTKTGTQIPLLVSLGADVERANRDGMRPLHLAVRRPNLDLAPDTVRSLIEHGADVNGGSRTPLEAGLSCTQNIDLADMAPIAQLFLDAGAAITPAMRATVERLGKSFEISRPNFNPDYLESQSAGLTALYELFDVVPVPPVPKRRRYDGHSPIRVTAGTPQEQYDALFDLLVPDSGPAASVQGEVIRLMGRLDHEIAGNGSINWDNDYRAMADALPVHLASGTALSAAELDEVEEFIVEFREGDGDKPDLDRLAELTVRWVRANPQPVPLPTPAYRC